MPAAAGYKVPVWTGAKGAFEMNAGMIGHNVGDVTIETEVRLFNSLFRSGGTMRVALPAGSTIADLLARLGIPRAEVHLAMVNGRDVTPRLLGGIETGHPIQEGDVVALSGPVPYSWGYGAPIV